MRTHRPSGRLRRWFCTLAATVLAGTAIAGSDRPIIAAASDLQFALAEVAERFEAETGDSLRLNFGSSGNFRRQIAQGAPFEMYLSADEAYVRALHETGHTVDDGRLYAIGRIVIMTPADGRTDLVDGSLQRLEEALAAGEIRRFAIANPEHAPYGVAAKQALEHAGLWDEIRPRLVYGENVSHAARFALSGEADGGIVAYSLARAPRIEARAAFELIDENRHAPLRQRMVLIRGAGETARAFYDFMQGEAARAILARYGFVMPEDE